MAPCLWMRGHASHLTNILQYCQGLMNQLEGIDKLVIDSFHSVLPGHDGFKDHDLQPGALVHWKRHQIEDSLQPHWKGPSQVLLTNPCVAKLKGLNSWIHISHFKKARNGPWSSAGLWHSPLPTLDIRGSSGTRSRRRRRQTAIPRQRRGPYAHTGRLDV